MDTMTESIQTGFPGIGCAYTDAEGNCKTENRGVRDRESGAPVDDDTIFPACSISKFVTALCVMRLCERSVIDIDAPVNAYLQSWKLRTGTVTESTASIRSLLSHTAGIADGEDAFYGLRTGDPAVSLLDILEGKTKYNDRPAREEKPQGTEFSYSDAGYCVLQQMLQDVTHKTFAETAKELLFDPQGLENIFFASPENVSKFSDRMAAGYDEDGKLIPGRFPYVPDLAASGLWSTPKDLWTLAREFVLALHGESALLEESSAREMAKPTEKYPWVGLGLFLYGNTMLVSNGWGENGQCMLKMDRQTGSVSVVMTNRNPGVGQEESGVEWIADRNMAAISD